MEEDLRLDGLRPEFTQLIGALVREASLHGVPEGWHLEHADELTALEQRDCGKPTKQARADAVALARYFEFYAGACDKLHGETIPYLDGYSVLTWREPHGVTGHIIPWNYPMQIFGRSVGGALAAADRRRAARSRRQADGDAGGQSGLHPEEPSDRSGDRSRRGQERVCSVRGASDGVVKAV